ncbi:MAG: hypothetical protein L6Q80_13945 [Dehalococcoidia bacterium]|nr:hypothetical protein [Dehalococcoidia bacterium]MCL4232017.1 hypothetical protein [Dehalococcoidia bacterium]
MPGTGSFFTIGAVPVPFAGGVSLFVAGYATLVLGCVVFGAGLAAWRKMRGN